MAAGIRLVDRLYIRLGYIIKKPQQLLLPGFHLVEECIMSGCKIRPRQFRAGGFNILIHVSSTPTAIAHIIKKDRLKMAAVVWLSTSLSKYFVRMECI